MFLRMAGPKPSQEARPSAGKIRSNSTLPSKAIVLTRSPRGFSFLQPSAAVSPIGAGAASRLLELPEESGLVARPWQRHKKT